jgi:hypothetical protein
MNDQVEPEVRVSGNEFLYYRTLFEIFKVYTTPKLKRVLDANNIKYVLDGKGKPLAHRDAVYGAWGAEKTAAPAAPAEPVPTEPSLS